MFFQMMCVRTREEMLAVNRMTPQMTEWVFGRVQPIQHDREGRPEYLDADVDAAIKDYLRAIHPDHSFYGEAELLPKPVGTKYVAERMDCTQAHVRNMCQKYASLRKTMVRGQAAREHRKFHKARVDKWIETRRQ